MVVVVVALKLYWYSSVRCLCLPRNSCSLLVTNKQGGTAAPVVDVAAMIYHLSAALVG